MKNVLIWFGNTFNDTWLSYVLKKAFYSLDNNNSGLSGKKLTAVALTYCIVKMHEYYVQFAFLRADFSLFPVILGADFGCLLTLFGINEYGKAKIRSIENSTGEKEVTE